MNYTLVGGYCGSRPYSETFFQDWYFNTKQTAFPQPAQIVVIDHAAPVKPDPKDCVWLPVLFNLGRPNQHVEGRLPHDLSGWDAGFLLGALYAYNNCTDYIYKEEDCLCFGPWVEGLYDACKGGGITYGHCQAMEIGISLILVKHEFIPELLRAYTSIPLNYPERKILDLQRHDCRWRQYPYGYDRDRPFNIYDEVFYLQKVVPQEVDLLRGCRLLPRKIQFGCGNNKLAGWENYDSEIDITKPLPFPDKSACHLFAEHAVEHVTVQQAYRFFEECYRLLLPYGTLRIAVPDAAKIWQNMDAAYASFTKDQGWSDGTRKGALQATIFQHGHQAAWTSGLLEVVLQSIGFVTKRCLVGQSDDPSLRGLEQHGRIVGEAFNAVETVCIEAVKIKAP